MLIIVGCCGYNSMFPVAWPVEHPSVEDVVSVDVLLAGRENNILGTDVAKMVTHIGNAKPTRAGSVNDSPVITPYYKIKISTKDKIYLSYVYEDNKKVYLECPYEGIYTMDSEVANILSKYF